MISLQDITIMRGTKTLIEGASATILAGQKVGIIGRNGCGKSTLFAAIQGEITPELGSIGVPKKLYSSCSNSVKLPISKTQVKRSLSSKMSSVSQAIGL